MKAVEISGWERNRASWMLFGLIVLGQVRNPCSNLVVGRLGSNQKKDRKEKVKNIESAMLLHEPTIQ
jgi:hypothetical protein